MTDTHNPNVVVVIRDPDFANDIFVYGVEANVIDVDLGATDLTELGDFLDWAEMLFEQMDDELPEIHPARTKILDVILGQAERYNLIDRAAIQAARVAR